MCILELSKVSTHEFHYDYIKNSRLLFIETDTLMYEIKVEDVYEDFSKAKKCFTLVIIQLNQNNMIIQTN